MREKGVSPVLAHVERYAYWHKDYDKIEETAISEQPKMIICGASAYSQDWDYKKFREIADKVEALLMADISHPAGLIAAKLLNDPAPYCHILTTTTHKTLR